MIGFHFSGTNTQEYGRWVIQQAHVYFFWRNCPTVLQSGRTVYIPKGDVGSPHILSSPLCCHYFLSVPTGA